MEFLCRICSILFVNTRNTPCLCTRHINIPNYDTPKVACQIFLVSSTQYHVSKRHAQYVHLEADYISRTISICLLQNSQYICPFLALTQNFPPAIISRTVDLCSIVNNNSLPILPTLSYNVA